jgi:signal transduction histidine kinase
MPHPLLEEETETASPPTVLVIDDDNLSLQIIAQALQQAKYRVKTTATVADGVRHAQQAQPNLIVANVAMPGIEGKQLIASLRESAPEASLIAMTEYGAEQLAANALKQGAEDYLTRPVHPWEITAAAAEVLERAALRRRNRLLAEALSQRQAELEQRNTELEDANARLREADTWKENLSNMIIHDLKNPLGVTQGAMVYFKGTLGDELDNRQSQLLDSALISTARALRLVSAILDVRRLEEGRMPLELRPVAPSEVIRTCLDESYPLLTIHELTYSLDVPEDLPAVRADHNTLLRIVGNLIDHAVKFTPAGGHISICARQISDGIQFSVSDTGYGIPPEQHGHIFEKFAQAGIRARGQRAGVGLGLTFCQLAVAAQRGRIWVESKQGIGTTFHFVLPFWANG